MRPRTMLLLAAVALVLGAGVRRWVEPALREVADATAAPRVEATPQATTGPVASSPTPVAVEPPPAPAHPAVPPRVPARTPRRAPDADPDLRAAAADPSVRARPTGPFAPVTWMHDLQAAYAQAAETERLVLLYAAPSGST